MTFVERQQLSLVSEEEEQEEEELTDVRQLSRSIDQTCASSADQKKKKKGWFPETELQHISSPETLNTGSAERPCWCHSYF